MKKDESMTALVNIAKKRVVPYPRTRFNIIPDESQGGTPKIKIAWSIYHTWLWSYQGKLWE
eukprot:12905345-Prorocentrum_lima.AAC.1